MNEVALITGASRGLGATLAKFLAAQDYDLILTARGKPELEELREELIPFAGQTVILAGDIANPDHRHRLVETCQRWGRLDLLINNASSLGSTPLPNLVDYSIQTFSQLLSVNLLAPLGLIQEAWPLLIHSQGLVINISSDAAVGGYPGWGAYGASKAALDLVSLTLAHEAQDDQVAVVSVDPGEMQTTMHQQAFPGEDISDRPLPEITLPFWAWLLGQDHMTISGNRLQAQAETWEIPV